MTGTSDVLDAPAGQRAPDAAIHALRREAFGAFAERLDCRVDRVMVGAERREEGADIRKDGNPELAREGAGSCQVLVDAITALQEQDLARHDDPNQMALFVWAAVHGVAMLAIDGRLGRETSAIESLTDYTTGRIRAAIAPAAT